MLNSLLRLHNYFDLDSEFDDFFRPIPMRTIVIDYNSDEESNRRIKRKKAKKPDSSTILKSYYKKSTINEEGKPETYSYENQIEDHFKNGHKYSKRIQNINKNGKIKCITDKIIDNKKHRIVSENNDDGSLRQKNFVKGFKEQKMIDFDRTFDENFNQIHGQKTKNFLESDDYQNPRLFLY